MLRRFVVVASSRKEDDVDNDGDGDGDDDDDDYDDGGDVAEILLADRKWHMSPCIFDGPVIWARIEKTPK